MNTNIVIGGIVALVVFVGGYLVLTLGQAPMMDEPMAMEDIAKTTEKEVMMDDEIVGDEKEMINDDMTSDAAGVYTMYDETKLALADAGQVVLYFNASWCPSCRALDSDIETHLSDIPAGVAILKIDYDTATELKQKYGITQQHTLVQVDSDGEEITKWTGSPTLAALLTKL